MNVDMLLRLDRKLREQKGFNAIRPEARLLFLLQKHGPLSVKEAMSFTQISYRGFYTVLERLVGAGLVSMVPGEQDRRVRKLVLDPEAIAALEWDTAPAADQPAVAARK